MEGVASNVQEVKDYHFGNHPDILLNKVKDWKGVSRE
jgi:hypothetical protein